MKRSAILLPSILLAATVLLAPRGYGAGMLLVDPIGPTPMPPPVVVTPVHPVPGRPTPRPTVPLLKGSVSAGLRLESADIKVQITDNVAKTFVSQVFANDSDRNLAGTYLFPLPKDTTFSSFSLMIDGKPVEGKILEAQEARTQYEAIVRRLVDPGLLEYADYKTVRARIFPIPAHGTKKVELEYTQLLSAENGMLKYNFPLKSQGSEEADELKVTVNMKSAQGLRTIWSPSHRIATTRSGDHAAKVEFDAKNSLADKDFCLYYSVSDKDLAANLVTNKASGEDGYYLLSLTPPVEAKTVSAKDVVLVLDTSGSMEGDRIKQSKEGLKCIIKALNSQDRFSIISFNTDVDWFKLNLVSATPENKQSAMKYIDGLEARGGTDIGDAMKSALSTLDTVDGVGRPAYLVLATDGEPTVGETSMPGLLKLANSKRDVRLFDFGVGYDVNTRLLDKLAEEHHGTSQYVEPSENLETAMSDFYNKIQKPVLTDVKVAYDGIDVKDVYPRDVKDIFAGSQVLLLGKYHGDGAATVKLTGTVNGIKKAYSFPVKFASKDMDNSYLPRMWAMRRIAHLTDVAKDNGDTREVVDEIVALSKKYGLISAYTSFLVTDPNEIDAHGNHIGMPVPMGRPAGFGGFAGGALPAVSMGAAVGAPGIARRNAFMSAKGRGAVQWYSAPREMNVIDDKSVVRNFRDEGTTAVASSESDFLMDWAGHSGVTAQRALKSAPAVGALAVKQAKVRNSLKDTEVAQTAEEKSGVKTFDDKTFYLRNGVWVDTAYDEKSSPKPIDIAFGTDSYFNLAKTPGIAKYLSVGKKLIFVYEGKAYRITDPASA
jgi:Ca-activated chloride channel family protein